MNSRFSLAIVVVVMLLATQADALNCLNGASGSLVSTNCILGGDKCMAMSTTTNDVTVKVGSCAVGGAIGCDMDKEAGGARIKTCCCSGDDCNDQAYVDACSPAVTNAASLVLSVGMAWLVKMLAY